MTRRVAERLLAYARDGLPIVLLGAWESASVPGVPREGDDERLRALVTDLLTQPTVRRVTTADEVPGALEALGVRPDVRYATPSTLLTMRRVAGRVDYYYLCNGKHQENAKPPVTAIDHEVTLARTDGNGVPYLLNPWTGRAERIARYTEDAGGIHLRVALHPGQARVIAIGRPGLFGDRTGTRPHATDTSADQVVYDNGHLVIRTTKAGRHTTTLSTGRTITTRIDEIPQPTELRAWHLKVRDRRPDGDHTHTLDLDRLAPWHDLPGLADVSGVGTYTTTAHLDGPAYLDLGEVTDTCRVRVNGHLLDPVDLLHPVIDVGPHLERGENTIEVEVATPLGNRLRQADPAVYGSLTPPGIRPAGPGPAGAVRRGTDIEVDL
ncbi:hypothetical protein [Nonomuraea salmonea]|uniref:hypothetical protein n=1 Tax=Nonomuraea salmonea TaxID=46181 RepID=UPI002FE7FB71